MAMDKSTSTWASSTAADKSTFWLAYEFASSQTVFVYGITATTSTTSTPKSWTFEGYNGSSWDTLDTQSNITAWSSNETKYFFTANTTAYSKYRINVSAQNGGTYTEIAEISMFSKSADMKISAERINTELDIDSIKISSERVNVDLRIVDMKISGIRMQVEFDEPSTNKIKKYVSGAWTGYPVKIFDGSWTTVTPKWYLGGSWNS